MYFTYWDDNLAVRMIILSLGSIALVMVLLYQLWRAQMTSLRLSASLVFLAFLSYEVFLIIRTISLILTPPGDQASLTPIQSATYLFAFALSIFWSTGFIPSWSASGCTTI